MKTINKSELQAMLGTFVRTTRDSSRSTILVYENGTQLQSYNTVVAARCKGTLYLYPEHEYSKTTCKHVTQWCGYSTAERRSMLDKEQAVFVEK